MTCIIVDDEPLAIDVIASYCEILGNIEIIAKCHTAMEALNVLNRKKVELIFCDIEMPSISGIDFIKSLEGQKPHIIFTTAYPEYALEGFNLNVTDYLVKPIPLPRFIKAVNKVLDQKKLKDHETKPYIDASVQNDFIFVKSEYENLKIKFNDILYIQGLKDYLKIQLVDNKNILTLMNFKEMIQKLNAKQFVRAHRSYIVNIRKINSIQKNKIVINNIRIPIGESYKTNVYKRLDLD